MTAFSEVRKLVLESAGADRAISELRLVLQAGGTVDEIGPGRLSAHDAHAIYEIRQRTARTAGVPIWGSDDLLAALHRLPRDRQLELFHFGTSDRRFTVLVDPETRSILGCASVPRRFLTATTPDKWDGRPDPHPPRA